MLTMTLNITLWLLALQHMILAVEYLQLRPYFARNGVWRGGGLGQYRYFVLCNALRLALAAAAFFWPLGEVSVGLLFCHLWVLLRQQKAFNGGSDYMLLLVNLGHVIVTIFAESAQVVFVVLGYLSVQVILSYFLAGLHKLKDKRWRSGQALVGILSHPKYPWRNGELVKVLSTRPWLRWTLAWLVLGFEMAWIGCLFDPILLMVLLPIGVCFHFVNALVLGLNRFVLAWVAAYPSLWWFAHQL